MIFDTLLRHEINLNDPNVPLTGNNLTALETFGGTGNVSAGGISVTPQTALHLSPVWAAVNVISSAVGNLPLRVHRRLEPSGSEVDRQHPASKLMRRPNDLMIPFTYQQLMIVHCLLYGNHVSLIVRDNAGRPLELLPFKPGQTRIFTKPDGTYWYEAWQGDMQITAAAIDVLHVKQFGFDGILGLSAVSFGKDVIGLGIGLNQYSNKFFKNNARPSLALQHPGHLTEEAHKRLKHSWTDAHSGFSGGGVAILEEGMALQVFGISNEDSQFVDSLQFNVADVARLFNISPHKLQDHSRLTFNNMLELQRSFLVDTLAPWLTAIEQECERKLLTEEEKTAESHQFKFNTRELLRVETRERFEAYRIGRETGWMSINDIRAAEDLPPVPNGDDYIQPLNFQKVGEDEQMEPTDDAARQNLVEAIHRIMGRLAGRAQKAAREPDNFLDWLDKRFESDNLDTVLCTLSTPLQILDRGTDLNELVTIIFDSLRADLLELSGRNSADTLHPAMERMRDSWLQVKPAKLAEDFLRRSQNGTPSE